MDIKEFIALALKEDIADGDHSTLACIGKNERGKAVLKIKQDGIIAGLRIAKEVFQYLEPESKIVFYKQDGDSISNGEIAFEIEASVHTILQGERLALNCMQRMSGVATLTNTYVQKIKNYSSKILDTRKTTPLLRSLEKEAVKIGGGYNHRFGLYDMIMLKDNHIDYAGSIAAAVSLTKKYLADNNLDLKIEVETRNIDEVQQVLDAGGVHRIMLDNYRPERIIDAIKLINGVAETEASGGINLDNIESYAATGVDFISIGALTHQAVSLDLSLKAVN